MVVLVGFAVLKLVSLWHPTRWLAQPNPILPFTEGTVLWLAVGLAILPSRGNQRGDWSQDVR
jgi:hypothetical protein